MCDRKILIGIGIGLIIASCLLSIPSKNTQYNDKATIEQKARDLGMVYPDEITAIPKVKEENNKND